MNDPAQVGSCTSCGAWAYAQSLCDPCSAKEPPEETPKILCSTCEDSEVDREGDNCEYCQEDAHMDRKCLDPCWKCEANILKGDCE